MVQLKSQRKTQKRIDYTMSKHRFSKLARAALERAVKIRMHNVEVRKVNGIKKLAKLPQPIPKLDCITLN